MTEPGPKKQNTASRQLRELQRLMAWSWDSRVEEHPPGEKAMHDFECVVNYQLDSRRRRTGTPSSAAAASPAPGDGSSPAVPISGAKAARRGSADRGVKRPSPGPASGEGKAGRKGSKAARADPSPADAAQPQQQQQTGGPLAAPADTAQQQQLAAADAASDGVVPSAPAASPAAAPQAAVEATPAVRQQHPACGLERSPALPGSASAVTPAAGLLAGVAQTPATAAAAATGPSTAGGSAATAALADGQCLPTPMPLPLSSVLRQQSTGVPQAPAAASGAAAEFRQPAPRTGVTLTSHKGKPEAEAPPAAATEPAQQLQQAEQQQAAQLMYHQPRPASCPPLFKQQALRMSRAASKSPLGQKHRSPAAGKENGGPANSSSGAAPLGFTPRTAEPAAPQPVALSAWKQQQLAALSAGFHSRQRRLLELLSACNRVQALSASQPAAAGPAGVPAAATAPTARPCDSKPPSGGKAARGRAAAAAVAAKPPLGPRAAAAGVGQVVGRLWEQQAVLGDSACIEQLLQLGASTLAGSSHWDSTAWHALRSLQPTSPAACEDILGPFLRHGFDPLAPGPDHFETSLGRYDSLVLECRSAEVRRHLLAHLEKLRAAGQLQLGGKEQAAQLVRGAAKSGMHPLMAHGITALESLICPAPGQMRLTRGRLPPRLG
ncbi:hypothetical protein C2E21_8020 [Chlorella sorokiniana]|uniref:Uncharacterized protein n=1 Tax=Chlorella sorokiniana TaxID=3076 RepID=A0A2P6TFY2_CHLSO|nr:hypothetical protein C2E21_8020 [Chlorella sorokiniana]|eukprot:PRW33022.1 hypothetical protein C2E21_8020 [Chlorella sorokiniana]